MNIRTAAPLLAVLTALVAGCSGGGGDKPTSLPSITSTPDTSSPAPVPPAATPKTPQGAASFARFYFDQLNIAFKTSNAELVKAFSKEGCGTCSIYQNSLTYGAAHGYRIEGDSFSVTDAEATAQGGGSVLVEVFGSIPAKREVDRTGRLVGSVSAHGPFHFSLTLASDARGWLVSEIKVNKP